MFYLAILLLGAARHDVPHIGVLARISSNIDSTQPSALILWFPPLQHLVDLDCLFYYTISTMASTEKRPDLIAIARDLPGVPMSDDYEKMISGML